MMLLTANTPISIANFVFLISRYLPFWTYLQVEEKVARTLLMFDVTPTN